MPETLAWLLIALGVVAIPMLIWNIRIQWDALQRVKTAKSNDDIGEQAHMSLKVLSGSVLDKQVEYSEACIRIKVILDATAPHLLAKKEFSVFNTVYEALQHMPTHEARKQTDKRFVHKLDQQRFEIEEQYAKEIEDATHALMLWLNEHPPQPAEVIPSA